MPRAASGALHVARVRSTSKGRTYESVLVRQTYREAGQVKHRTLASLTRLPTPVIEVIERAVRGEQLVSAQQAARACGGGGGLGPHARLRGAGGSPAQPPAGPGAGDGGGPGAAAGLQAGDHSAVVNDQSGIGPGGGGGDRGRAVWGHGLAAGAAGADRAALGQAVSGARWGGAVRPELDLR